MPQPRRQWDQSLALTDERQQRGTTGVVRRSNLGSETAMPLQMLGDSDSPRQRVLKSSRLALGGAVLGTALTGLIGRVVGGNDSTLIDLMGAGIGAAIVALGLLASYHYSQR
jgi:hypothetical protein